MTSTVICSRTWTLAVDGDDNLAILRLALRSRLKEIPRYLYRVPDLPLTTWIVLVEKCLLRSKALCSSHLASLEKKTSVTSSTVKKHPLIQRHAL